MSRPLKQSAHAPAGGSVSRSGLMPVNSTIKCNTKH
jgi:hypothetical protein